MWEWPGSRSAGPPERSSKRVSAAGPRRARKNLLRPAARWWQVLSHKPSSRACDDAKEPSSLWAQAQVWRRVLGAI